MKNNKEKNISLRLSNGDYEIIERYSSKIGMNVSEFIRFSALAAAENRYVPQSELLKLCHQLGCYKEIQRNQRIMEYLKGVCKRWL